MELLYIDSQVIELTPPHTHGFHNRFCPLGSSEVWTMTDDTEESFYRE